MNDTPRQQTHNIDARQSQIGVVGDHAHVEGGIHFHREVIIYDSVKPVSAGALLDACQAQVTSVLYDARHKYDPKLYVKRAICSRRCCTRRFGGKCERQNH